jgi:hypothetical protein
MFGLEIHWPANAVEWAAWSGLFVAIATIALAIATFRLARTTGEEMDLLRGQTGAMKEQADVARAQLEELRGARFAEFLPMLRWQSPSCRISSPGA